MIALSGLLRKLNNDNGQKDDDNDDDGGGEFSWCQDKLYSNADDLHSIFL